MSSKHFLSTHKNRIKAISCLLILLFAIDIINSISGRSLSSLGIVPRRISSLAGIFISPFIHGNLAHLLSNALPLAMFSFLLMMHGIKRYVMVSLWIIVVGGGLVWLLGREASHIGASGVIYGYFAYLVVAGFLAKEFKLLLISLFVMIGYGGMIWGVLPISSYVSWEGHLFGAAAGVMAAFIWSKKKI